MKKALLIIFLLVFTRYSMAAVVIDRIVAVVGRDVITWSELYKSMEFEFSDKIAGLKPAEKKAVLERFQNQYLEKMIDLKVQLNEARKMNINVTESEVDRSIAMIRKKYGLNEKEFMKTIEAQGLTYDEYKERIYEQMLASKAVNLAVANKIIVTDEDIDAYLKENKGSSEEGYRLRQIFLAKLSPEDNKRILEKVKIIMEHLKKGEPFDTVALRYSEGPNASRGGDLGFIKKEDLAPEFLKVVQGLKEGQYSEPFWSGRGLHILYLQEKIQPGQPLRDKVREIIYEEKFNKALKEWVKNLRSKYYIEVKIQ